MTDINSVKHWTVALILSTTLSTAANAEPGTDTLPTLWYDAGGDQLFKIADSSLFRTQTTSIEWQEIERPNAWQDFELTSVVTAVNGNDVIYVSGRGLGVWESSDQGQTWSDINEGLPSQAVVALAAHRDQPGTLYAALDQDGLYRTQDAGQNWKKMDGGPVQPIHRLVHSDMEGSMETGWLYAVSDDAVRLSMDCFCGWRLSGSLEAGGVFDVAYDQQNPQRVYAATDTGVWVSTNGGQQWQLAKNTSTPMAIAHIPDLGLVGINSDGKLLHLDLQ